MKSTSIIALAAGYLAGAALALRHAQRKVTGKETSPAALKAALTDMHRSLGDEAKEKMDSRVPWDKITDLKDRVISAASEIE